MEAGTLNIASIDGKGAVRKVDPSELVIDEASQHLVKDT